MRKYNKMQPYCRGYKLLGKKIPQLLSNCGKC